LPKNQFALRKAIHETAITASTSNPVFSAFYQKLIAAEKPSNVALTAIMRKLGVVMNTLIKSDKMWDEETA